MLRTLKPNLHNLAIAVEAAIRVVTFAYAWLSKDGEHPRWVVVSHAHAACSEAQHVSPHVNTFQRSDSRVASSLASLWLSQPTRLKRECYRSATVTLGGRNRIAGEERKQPRGAEERGRKKGVMQDNQ